jgi:hypothetical protein
MNDEFNRYVKNAMSWAERQLGSTAYPFLCLAFVENAYEQSNQVEIFGGSSAKESAEEYEAHQNTESLPPLGAFVFYDCWGVLNDAYKNWGHVGLSVGEGQVVHAWDVVRLDNYLEVQSLTPAVGWTQPQYIGWVPVERIFRGYRKRA